MDYVHRPTTFVISQGLHASIVACVHRLGDIGRGLRASTMRHRQKIGDIIQGLHALDVACAHLVNAVGQRHAESTNAFTHQPWCVRIGWAPPTKACAHRPTTGDIGQGLHDQPWCVGIWKTTSAN
jgi:hypothetical protein